MWLQKDWKCSPAYVMGSAHWRSNSRLDTPPRFSIEHSSARWKAKTCFVVGIKLVDSICLPAWPFAVIEWPNAFWVLLSYVSSRSCCSPSMKYLSPVPLWSLRPKLVANPVSTPLLIMYNPLRMSRIADMLPLVCIKMHASSIAFEPFGTPVWDRCQEQICRVPSREQTSSTVTFAYSQFSARSFPRPYFLTCELVLAHQLFILLFKHSSNQVADDHAFLVAISAYCSLYFCHRLNSRRRT